MSERDKKWIKGIATSLISTMIVMTSAIFLNMYVGSKVQAERNLQSEKMFFEIKSDVKNIYGKMGEIKDNYVKKSDYENDKKIFLNFRFQGQRDEVNR